MAGTYWMPKAIAAISANRRPRALSLAMAQGGEGVEALRVRVWGGGGALYTVYGVRLRTCGAGQQGIQLHVCAGRSLIFVVMLHSRMLQL